MLNKNQKGFVDPLSLLTIAFLVVSLFVGTAVVSNEGFNFDIREKAAPFLPDEAPEIQKAIKKAVESNKSIKEKQEIVNKGVEEAQERERQEREEREREEEEARRRQEENARNACEQEQGRWVNGRCQTQNTPPSSGSGGTSLADGTCTSVSNVCGRSGCAANQKCQYSAAAGRPICVADA